VCERTLREAEDERAMLVERLQAPYLDAAEQLARTAAELESRYSHDVLQLAAMLAEQIVGRTVELDPEVVLLGLERALSAVGPVSTAVIHCSPGDADIIATKARELPSLRGRTIDLRIEPRQELPSGGVTVEFSDGSADARLATQLDELVRTVEKAVLDPQRAGSRR
jgi:flagellar biosynthesis/type III secretory pathway protein FliH